MKDVLVAALQFLEAITRLAEAGILFWLAYSELKRRRKEAKEAEEAIKREQGAEGEADSAESPED